MTNITPHVLRYRDAARQLWNSFLREDDALRGGAISTGGKAYDWDALKQLLFTTLVLRHTNLPDQDASLLGVKRCSLLWNEPIPFLRVVPSSPKAPVMISRDTGRTGYWDHPVNRLGPDDADLRFIDFFDFGQAGYLDFKYYRALLANSQLNAELSGHEVLIEAQYADVFVDEPRKGKGKKR